MEQQQPSRRGFLGAIGLSALLPPSLYLEGKAPFPSIHELHPMPAGHNLLWGTYGKDLKYYPNIRVKRLDQCSDDHLRAIIATESWHLAGGRHLPAIVALLEYRAKHNLPVADNEDYLAEFDSRDEAAMMKWYGTQTMGTPNGQSAPASTASDR